MDVCDGYYPKSGPDNEWLSKKPQIGWVWLQHNPQYDGSNTMYSALVYTDENGKVMSSKGALGLSVRQFDPNGEITFATDFEKPNAYSIAHGGNVSDNDIISKTAFQIGKVHRNNSGQWQPGNVYTDGDYTSTAPATLEGTVEVDQQAVNYTAKFFDLEPVQVSK